MFFLTQDVDSEIRLRFVLTSPKYIALFRSMRGFWPTVLSVAPLLRHVVCLSVCLSSVVCDVLYSGETVRLS